MKNRLTEEDLEKIFITSRVKKKNYLVVFLKFFALFILFFLIIVGALNFSAYKQKITYWYQDEFFPEKEGELSKAVLGGSSDVSKQKAQLPNIPDNSLYIESIDVRVPITFRVPNDASDVSDNLRKGLIHLEGSSLPGEQGNVFITGHSSNYPWVKSKYNSVFALLDKMVVGDLILIKFQDINYVYQVKEKFVTSPTNTTVINPFSDKPTLSLMTCTPIGTNFRRLIIRAEQILPDPTTARPSSASDENKNLPDGVH